VSARKVLKQLFAQMQFYALQRCRARERAEGQSLEALQ